jgi:hypothetical protein
MFRTVVGAKPSDFAKTSTSRRNFSSSPAVVEAGAVNS